MNQTNFSNRFMEASYNKDTSLLVIRWLPETYQMSEETYRSTFMQIADFIAEHKVQLWMGYTKNFAFIIPPELQEWTAGEFNQKLKQAGLKKMAMIMPSDYIASLSVQQSVKEMENQKDEGVFETSYFDNPEQAQKWLLEA